MALGDPFGPSLRNALSLSSLESLALSVRRAEPVELSFLQSPLLIQAFFPGPWAVLFLLELDLCFQLLSLQGDLYCPDAKCNRHLCHWSKIFSNSLLIA